MNIKNLKCVDNNIDIDSYLEFRKYIKENMKKPEWLRDLSKEDLIDLLNRGSKVWIYYMDNTIVCSMMLIPADKKLLRKLGVDYDSQEVADYGSMFVNPKFIGNKLQYQMLNFLDEYCIKQGYKYAVTTIDPNNIYSIRNILNDGFEFYNIKVFTRGVRNVYLKRLV